MSGDQNTNPSRHNQAFPLSHRLAHSYEFDAVFNNNKARVSTPSLLLLAKPNNVDFCRLGMVVSKKSIPGSVQRNDVKRRIREAFRVLRKPRAGWDIIVLTRPKIRAEKNLAAHVEESFQSLTDKLGC